MTSMLRKNESCENCGHIGKFHDHHDNNECCYEGCTCKNMVFTDTEWEKIREFERTSNCEICKKNFIVRTHERREDYRTSMLINQKMCQDCTMTHKVVDNKYYQKEMIEMACLARKSMLPVRNQKINTLLILEPNLFCSSNRYPIINANVEDAKLPRLNLLAVSMIIYVSTTYPHTFHDR